MFIELMPLLGERTVMLIVARIDQNRIRVNVIPTRKREDENAALCAPLSFSGTPEEVDGAMARNLGVYVEENLRLQHTLEEAKAEMAPRRRPHVSRPTGKQVRPQSKRNCRVDNKPIRQGPRPRRIRKIPRYFRLADDPEVLAVTQFDVATHLGDG